MPRTAGTPGRAATAYRRSSAADPRTEPGTPDRPWPTGTPRPARPARGSAPPERTGRRTGRSARPDRAAPPRSSDRPRGRRVVTRVDQLGDRVAGRLLGHQAL